MIHARHQPLLAAAIVGVDTFAYAVLLPTLPAAVQSTGAPAWVTGAMFAGYTGAQLLLGRRLATATDRHRARPWLLGAQAGTVVATTATIASGALWVVVGARVLDGATGATVAIANAHAHRHAAIGAGRSTDVPTGGRLDGPEAGGHRDMRPGRAAATALGRVGQASGIGVLAGLAVAAAVADGGLVVASMVATAAAVSSMALAALVRDTTPGRDTTPVRETHGRDTTPVRETPGVRHGLWALGTTNALQAGLVLALPLLLAGARIEVGDIRAATGLVAAAGITQAVAAGPLLRRYPPALVARTCAIVAGTALVGAAAVPTGLVATAMAAVAVAMALLAATAATAMLGGTAVAAAGATHGSGVVAAGVGQLVGPATVYAAATISPATAWSMAAALAVAAVATTGTS